MSEFDDRLNALLSDPDSMAQIVQLAQQLSGQQPPPPEPPQGAAGEGFDPQLLKKLLPLLQDASCENGQSSRLLTAIRPYLRPEKQEKVAEALRMAHLITLGKRFMTEGDMGHV